MSDKREKAVQVLKKMMPDVVDIVADPPKTGFAPELNDLAMTICFEPLWARDGLDLRTRSLINVAMLIVQRAHSELAFHGPAAIRNGATIAELEEVIYHAAGYAGFPAAVSAREAIGEALKKAGMV
jgi:4-carboxymuconolactone decarboxylase